MEKRISYDQFMSVKRVAQAVNPLVMKRDKLKKKMDTLQQEYNDYDAQVATLESGIKQVIGFRVQELVKKVIEPTTDKNGKEVKVTKYVPTDIVTYDKDTHQYVITVPEPVEGTNVDTDEATDVAEPTSDAGEDNNI